MGGVSGTSANFGFEALSVAMSKRATEAQGQIALNLVEASAQSAQQVSAASSNGRVGSVIDVQA